MSIKFEVQSIKNSQGKGEDRNFIRIFEYNPMTAKQLKSQIQATCSLTEGDIEATLSALREHMIRELSAGKRVYIPSIGYFSLSVDLNMPNEKQIEKVRGNHISVRNIKFRPEMSMLQEIKDNARFEHADYSTVSFTYTEDEMLEKIKEYLSVNHCITRSKMESQFGLRKSAALKWLKHFTDIGVLKKEGSVNSPVYFLA